MSIQCYSDKWLNQYYSTDFRIDMWRESADNRNLLTINDDIRFSNSKLSVWNNCGILYRWNSTLNSDITYTRPTDVQVVKYSYCPVLSSRFQILRIIETQISKNLVSHKLWRDTCCDADRVSGLYQIWITVHKKIIQVKSCFLSTFAIKL